ncbi:hypothetical protein OG416_35335 (plasmid) [Streptomyces longwoodensis]|nr:hypothetical protein OG416_35335 [Streptomyces longwoodensis]
MHAAPADTGAHHAVLEGLRHSSIASYARGGRLLVYCSLSAA